jgi:DNA topoisomerase-3
VPAVTGWRAVIGERSDDEDDEDRAELPRLKQGDAVRCAKAEVEQKQTQPPTRYTEGTLIQAMKSVGRQVQDVKLRQVLKETSGIGTEATRAAIIETLLGRTYIERRGKKKHLVSTPKGRALIAAVPEAVKDVATTAIWEQALDEIASGRGQLDDFLAQQRASVTGLVLAIKAQTALADHSASATSQPHHQPPSPPKAAAAKRQETAANAARKSKVCPKCKTGELVQKTARKGSRSGQQFWACNRWPQCSFVQNG